MKILTLALVFMMTACGSIEDLANSVDKASSAANTTHNCDEPASKTNSTSTCTSTATSSNGSNAGSTTTTTINSSSSSTTSSTSSETITTSTSGNSGNSGDDSDTSSVPEAMQGVWASACNDGQITQIQFTNTMEVFTSLIYKDTTCATLNTSYVNQVSWTAGTNEGIQSQLGNGEYPTLFQDNGITMFEVGGTPDQVAIGNYGTPVSGQEVYTKQAQE